MTPPKTSHNAPQKKVQAGSQPVQTVREIDPNILQRQASDPGSSVWVGASAGSGKTKVLTDRVLRLLLPRDNGQPGTLPHKILCITFTKAGASEMSLRLGRTLANWAVLPEDGPGKTLTGELTGLLGRAPVKTEIAAARRLFAEVSDAPGGLQIMTIHSFCQSVLGRFPLEAGLAPHFTVLEERESGVLLSLARDAVMHEAVKGSPLAAAIHNAGSAANDDQFLRLIENLGSERAQLQKILTKHFGVDGAYTELCRILNILPGQTPDAICREACEDKAFDVKGLRALQNPDLGHWLASDAKTRAAAFNDYALAFLTKDGDIRKKLKDKTMLAEAARLLKIRDDMNAARCALLTRDLLILGQAILEKYQTLKTARGALDFDDLIALTQKLLENESMAAWVLYKLDQGIDHILIDEAQDTNPEQWGIALALAREFFAGLGARDTDRTTFTVGDEKQSIYSFQRASPQKFHAAYNELEALAKGANKDWRKIDLNISFRSVESVLRAVDSTFANPVMRAGLGLDEITHHSFRRGQAGLAELWPVSETPDAEDIDPWQPPVRISEQQTGAARLAQKIAREIRGWIDNKEQLPSRDREIRAEDILILVRTRNAFVQQLARELKRNNIPVSGVDRMILNEQLAVQDMLALAEFALLPTDDLTLATVLKSPLIGWDDDRLFTIAADRPASLWEAVKSAAPAESEYLNNLINDAGAAHPYEFFSAILQRPCPADDQEKGGSGLRAFAKRLGPDALDPLDELLSAALGFERGNIASLQNFLRWQSQESSGIKREMDEPKNEVRIMTVHGSKGLQAPIVILPDTLKTAGGGGDKPDRRLLWPDKSELPVPIWCPRSDIAPEKFTQALARIDEKQDEEYRRLLYVAMTRAEDRLYIAGHTGKKTPQEQSWYFAVKSGLERLDDCQMLDDGRLRIANPQTRGADKPGEKSVAAKTDTKLPAWLREKPKSEPAPPTPLVPSRPSGDAPVFSPLGNDGTCRFRRGNLTHKLLQFLPDLPPPAREAAAKNYLARYGNDVPTEMQTSIAGETLRVLNHPDFAPIFGPGSQAEVPITGLIDNTHVISGQIDRLLITDNEILIVDYKTNRPPPRDPKDIPPVYRAQMQAYAKTLAAIYPGRIIRCALLWTDGPRLMELSI